MSAILKGKYDNNPGMSIYELKPNRKSVTFDYTKLTRPMPDQDKQSENKDDIFDFDCLAELESNQRKTVRYVRDDITASIKKNTLLSFGKQIKIKLLDISTKGALISIDKKLKVKTKISLNLEFNDGKTFQIDAKVVRKADPSANTYGIQFNKYDNELGEHLFNTQTDLIFK